MLIAFALASSGFIAALLLIEAENRITSWIYSFIKTIIGSNDSKKIECTKVFLRNRNNIAGEILQVTDCKLSMDVNKLSCSMMSMVRQEEKFYKWTLQITIKIIELCKMFVIRQFLSIICYSITMQLVICFYARQESLYE